MLYRQCNASVGENFSDEPWDALLRIPDVSATCHETAQDSKSHNGKSRVNIFRELAILCWLFSAAHGYVGSHTGVLTSTQMPVMLAVLHVSGAAMVTVWFVKIDGIFRKLII
jgi:hypothetical protein